MSGHRRRGPESSRGYAARARGAHRVMALLLTVLLVRVLYLQLVDHERLLDLAKDNVLREEVLPAIRGVIRDRHGEILVDSEPSFTVAVDPFHRLFRQQAGTLEKTLARLSTIIDLEPSTMIQTIEQEKGRSYLPVYLKRHLDPATVAYIEEHREELPGISIEIEPRRNYVHGTLAAHFLGYVGEITDAEVRQPARERAKERAGRGILTWFRGLFGNQERGEGKEPEREDAARRAARGTGPREYRPGDVIGRSGVEEEFEDRLCGRNGVRMVEVNALGRRVDPLMRITSFAEVVPPLAGEEMVLTLDLELQKAAEAAFPESLSGAVVAIDPMSGEILVALSRPSFDPNEFSKGFSGQAWKALSVHPAHPLLNRVLRSAYPPGSLFKIVTGAAGLTEKAVSPDEILRSCTGGYPFGDRYFRCHHVHGTVSFVDAMRVSCDTYFYQVGLKVGLDALGDFAGRFGFGQTTGIVLGERSGIFPDRAWYDRRYGTGGWTRGLILNLAIGQGEILATPLQLAVMMAATGTGRVVVPQLVRRIGDGPDLEPSPPRKLEVPDDVRQLLVHSLERVVSDGTGRRARVRGVQVAGKTGTAQNPHGEDHALFGAFAPSEAPEIALAVVIENVGHGGEFAAPVAREILEAYFSRRGDELAAGD